MQDKKLIFKLSSLLLQYPEESWINKEEIQEGILSIKDKYIQQSLLEFYMYLQSETLEKVTEEYVVTFDFSDKTTFYLSYSLYGDQRERGEALLRLKQKFTQAGIIYDTTELPDYLPLLLEFAYLADDKIVQELFNEYLPAIEKLTNELDKMESPYKKVIEAVLVTIKAQDKAKSSGGVS